jgi:hypothetical protein
MCIMVRKISLIGNEYSNLTSMLISIDSSLEVWDSSQSITLWCNANKAMIKGSAGKGSPLSLIATEYL